MTDIDKLTEMLKILKISVPGESLPRLLWFRDELLRWNKRINLTAISDPDEALEKHLVDSLTLLPFLPKGSSLLDIGSGGGFPAIPLKIADSSLTVWSVDSSGKKIAFQNHISRALSLDNFAALNMRAEFLPQDEKMPVFDFVVARAFASIGTILDLGLPLLGEGGRIVAMKGPEATRELKEAGGDLGLNKLICCHQHDLQLPVSGASRSLMFFSRQPA